jgi:transmembrane sensor
MSKSAFEDLKVRRQRALQEAAAWQVRLQEEPADGAARGAYTDWLRESPLHVAAMLRVSQIDRALTAFDGWVDTPGDSGPFNNTVVEWPTGMDVEDQSLAPGRGASLIEALVPAMAAVMMLVASVAVLWWIGFVGGSVFETASAERRNVALLDGSTVVLGPHTRVRVTLSSAERRVVLERGEAVFKVAKDPGRPFIVAADRSSVRAVGTEFGVEQRADTLVVTVAEGRVAVTQNTLPTLLFSAPRVSGTAVAVEAGEQLAIPHAGKSGSVRKFDNAEPLDWAKGRLVFNNDTIRWILERFNQYNRVQMTVTDPTIAERRISGSFDASDPESLLKFLRSCLPVTITRTSRGGDVAIHVERRSADPPDL